MSERQRRFFSAPTLDRALIEAAGYLEITVEEVRYQEVPKKKGLARGRGVTIRIDRAASEEASRESAPAVEPPSEESAESAATPEVEGGDEPEVAASGEASEEALAAEEVEAAAGSEDATAEGEAQESRTEEETQEPEPEEPEEAEEPIATDATDAADAREESASSSAFPETGPSGDRVEFPAGPEDLVAAESDPENEITGSAARWIEAILDLADLDAEARVEEREGPLVWLDLSGPDEDLLLEDSGQLLQAIQHLMPRLMQSDLGCVVPCVADSGGFREFHGERLRVQAVTAAEAVRRDGRAISLEPMNPPDRREVHMALADDPAVDTESSGRGYFKRITVRPA